jgi:hypothetical protein
LKPRERERERERERYGKDRRRVDSRGEVRDTFFPRGKKEHHFVRRFPGYDRSSFWYE